MISIMSDWKTPFDAAPVSSFAKGAALFRRNDQVKVMYLVRAGEVALERPMADGTQLTLHIATKGTGLAEASLFAETYHCDAVARSDTQVASLRRPDLLRSLENDPSAALSLIATQAKEIQRQRARIEILRLRRVSDRLDYWLELYGKPRKGEWVTVAQQIGVSSPALYRELARRQKR